MISFSEDIDSQKRTSKAQCLSEEDTVGWCQTERTVLCLVISAVMAVGGERSRTFSLRSRFAFQSRASGHRSNDFPSFTVRRKLRQHPHHSLFRQPAYSGNHAELQLQTAGESAGHAAFTLGAHDEHLDRHYRKWRSSFS